MNKIGRAIGVCIVLLALLSGCTRDEAISDPCAGCPSNISFKGDIIPIFEASCSLSGCHDATTHAAAVILDSAHAYLTVTEPGTGYIIKFQADASILYTTLNAPGVNGMPKGLPPLPQCQVDAIACWINQGAKNN
jgi:hypothetical protein